MKTLKMITNRFTLASAIFVAATIVSIGSYACGDSAVNTPATIDFSVASQMVPVDSMSILGDDFNKTANCSSRNIDISIAPPTLKPSVELNLAAIN